MKRKLLSVVMVLAGPALAAGGEAAFSAKPSAVKDGDKVKIAFAVAAPTDVEVAVLGADGKVVRHLAAGALGAKEAPPAPLKPGLVQELTWDGKDDAGKPVTNTPVRIRTSAGLGVKYAGTAFGSESRPDYLTPVIGLAAGPDGRVCAMSQRWSRGWWTLTTIHAFKPDGTYEKTIKPYPATLGADRVGGLTALRDPAGRPVPTIHRVISLSLYPAEDFPQQMAVDPKGNLHLIAVPPECGKVVGPERWLASLAPDGAPCYERYVPAAPTSKGSLGEVFLAAATDGTAIFATGVTRAKEDPATKRQGNTPIVARIPLPARDQAEPFFGDPAQAGDDDKHLKDPRGLAVDGKGRLLVADSGNNRVVILNEKDGQWIGSFAVPSPTWIGAHGKNGAVYVASAGALIKFALDAAGKAAEKSKFLLPIVGASEKERAGIRRCFALEAAGDAPVLWVGMSGAEPALARCAEQPDGTFGELKPAGYQPGRTYWNLDAGVDGRSVSCKVGNHWLRILDEDTGQTRELTMGGYPQTKGWPGQTYRLGPNGQIYGIDHWQWGVRRFDRDGQPLPFPATKDHPDAEGRGRLANAPSGTTSWERDLAVDPAGNIYVKHRGPTYHGRMRVDKYDPDGKFLGTVLWVVSDGMLGPQLDAAGNLYIAENIKPVGEPYPAPFKGKLPAMRVERGTVETQYAWMYGSIIKFSPAGGAVWFPKDHKDDVYAFEGQAKLAADLPKTRVETGYGEQGRILPAELQGALWYRYGMSYILDMHPATSWRCHCTSTDFDVDPYGRCFYTDQGRFCVIVLDTAGNQITRFGSYGNQDSCGPEVAFNLFTGLAVTDRNLYVADGGHRRVLRLEKTYAAQETCEVK